MGEMILDVKGINKSFGSLNVLNGVGFKMKQGEKIVILGPSGSGKSTMLRCINGLENFQSGEILFRGDKITQGKINYFRKDVGMVFQKFNLFSHMTVLQNIVEAPIRVRGIKKEIAIQKAMNLLKKVGLEDKADVNVKTLSGGQQQRVAIARALAMEPKIMLFDEPTSALDPELVGEVLKVMKDVANDGMSMIVVTHEIGFAKEVADRILFMEDGNIVCDNDNDSFFNCPTTDRIKQFISRITND